MLCDDFIAQVCNMMRLLTATAFYLCFPLFMLVETRQRLLKLGCHCCSLDTQPATLSTPEPSAFFVILRHMSGLHSLMDR